MTFVTIDAGVLAVPAPGGPPNLAHEYVDTLLDWRRLLDEPWVAIHMSERATESLITDGLYPFRQHLQRLFASAGVEEYDVNTVAQAAERLLMLTPTFETYFLLRDVLTESVIAEPDVLQLVAGAALQSDLARCLVLIAILRAHCQGHNGPHSLVLRRSPDSTIRVRAIVHDLEHNRDDIDEIPYAPDVFEGEVLTCNDFRGLAESLDESGVLLGATDRIGVETATRLAVFKARLIRGEACDWDDTRSMLLHDVFCRDIIRCCQDQPDSFTRQALRAVVETADSLNMSAAHALRTGPGGGNPQIVRRSDGAKAWRRDISDEYHLHYWQLKSGAIELASVGVHNDFSIPE